MKTVPRLATVLGMCGLVIMVFGQTSLNSRAETILNLEYAKPEGKTLCLDLYLPEGETTPRPLVIYVHGGAWEGGNKDHTQATGLVKRGYAVASINYRLSQVAKFPAQIHDCKAAVRFLRANARKYNLDPERFGAWGESAGGHLVALLGTTGDKKELEGDLGNNGVSSRVQAVCDYFGPTDFVLFKETRPEIPPDNAITRLFGGNYETKRDLFILGSPVTHVTKGACPFLILHGDRDTLVPLNQSQALESALKKAGVEVVLKVMEGEGHGFRSSQLETVTEFFNKQLKASVRSSK